ncbi:hypothetical protein [Mycolicibacterium moriokaense]|uniref:Uncharacterized protein n=1 Tax=Mycolicibacterium moriokaense TaxID=39691 RepID=A0A318HA70_9MYCO|nr:hypothetical protein [Mycolicibacterium moriokaense]PXW97382.1 hypothetical protein C8E89_1483 [Mycolicibacterium moriokaense]
MTDGAAAKSDQIDPYEVPAHVVLNLTGPALVGGFAGQLDEFTAGAIARRDAGVPEVGTVHTIYERRGVVVRDFWSESRLDGTGRHGSHVDAAARRNAYEVRIDLDSRPASARLKAALDVVEARAMQAGMDRAMVEAMFVPFHNALAVTDRAGYPFDRELIDISALLRHLALFGSAPTGGWATAADDVVKHMRAKRFALEIDTGSAAAILIAAHVPATCAVAAEALSLDAARTYRELMALAAERLRGGMLHMLKELVEGAASDGYLGALYFISERLLAEAVALREHALDSPPDPVEFTRRLFDIPPYAEAAKLICQWARECVHASAVDLWARRQTQAEELRVRAAEGLCSQYINWVNEHHMQERRLIAAAQARGDRRAVFRLLREGEFRLMRPKSYRSFLEGHGAPPAIAS